MSATGNRRHMRSGRTGAGGAWGRADWGLLVIAACIAGAATLIAMRASDARAALAPVALLGAFAVLHAVQLLPRPGWMPGALWPGRLAVEERIGTAAITGGFWRPASMDSSATVDSLLLLAAYASAALVGGAVFGRRTRFVRLAAVLGAVGLAAAAAGLGGFLGGKGLHPGRLSGSYTNPNRYCDLIVTFALDVSTSTCSSSHRHLL